MPGCDPTAHAEVTAIRNAAPGAGYLRSERLRDIHLVRTVSDVPRRDLLGPTRPDVLCQRQERRGGDRLRRLVHIRRVRTSPRPPVRCRPSACSPTRRSARSSCGATKRTKRRTDGNREHLQKKFSQRSDNDPATGARSSTEISSSAHRLRDKRTGGNYLFRRFLTFWQRILLRNARLVRSILSGNRPPTSRIHPSEKFRNRNLDSQRRHSRENDMPRDGSPGAKSAFEKMARHVV